MRVITIQKSSTSKQVQDVCLVCITDLSRKNEKSVFNCSVDNVADIVKLNLF